MVFEILNTLRFIIFVIVAGVVYYYASKKFVQLKFKYFLLGVLIVAGITHTQFYTLTEKNDTIKTSNMMLQQKNNFNNKELRDYLKDSENIAEEDFSLEDEILKQKKLSEDLIIEMKEEKQ